MAHKQLMEERGLPGSEERRKILEHAREVALQARAILERLEQLDGGFSASAPPAQGWAIAERVASPSSPANLNIRQL